MTTAAHDPTTPDGDPVTEPAETGVGAGMVVADSAPPPPVADHPDPSAATTARWESDGGHLHR